MLVNKIAQLKRTGIDVAAVEVVSYCIRARLFAEKFKAVCEFRFVLTMVIFVQLFGSLFILKLDSSRNSEWFHNR